MADVQVGGISSATCRGARTIVWVTDEIGYFFYIATNSDVAYIKTIDGGVSWSGEVEFGPDPAADVAIDVWFDQWTPGDTGTLIHIWWFGFTQDDVFHQTLDTTNDSLGTQRIAFDGFSVGSGRGTFVSGTKAVSGYLYMVAHIDTGSERGLFRSTDGVNWSLLSNTFIEAYLDECLLFPAIVTGDDNDIYAIYHDASANAITLKLWDSSAGVASESATIVAYAENPTDFDGQHGFSASLRHTDGHLILAVVTEYDTATSDHRVFDIAGIASITELTAIATNKDDHYYPQVYIDPSSEIYVAYNGKRDGTESLGAAAKIYYVKSTDGGATWSAGDTPYMDDGLTDTVTQVWAAPMGPRFYPIWRRDIIAFGNEPNSVVPVAAPVGLIVSGATHAHTVDSVVLTQANVLSVASGLHAHSAGVLDLVQAHLLSVDGALHGHLAEAVGLLQGYVLSPDSALHNHLVDGLTLTQASQLIVQDALHGHLSVQPELLTGLGVEPDSAVHGHTVDHLILTQANLLEVQDALHGHFADNLALDLLTQLVVQSALHSHTVDGALGLIEAGALLTIQDALHIHTAGNVDLTQANILTVQDALHAHLADLVLLLAETPETTNYFDLAERLWRYDLSARKYIFDM